MGVAPPLSDPERATPLVELAGLRKTYAAGKATVAALRDVSLTVGDGEFVAVVGPSGCGKSTMLRIIAGISPATGGHVRVGGEDPLRGRVRIGMVFQTPVLLPWRSVLSNVLLPIEISGGNREAALRRAQELLGMVGLAGFEDRRPYQLSGGMEQRAALCRALITDPVLLLADEPFGALDALTRERLNLELQTVWMAARKTVIFVTHSIVEAVFLADRVLVMRARPGSIEEDVPVPLPRPRDLALQDTAEFGQCTREIRRALERASKQGGT